MGACTDVGANAADVGAGAAASVALCVGAVTDAGRSISNVKGTSVADNCRPDCDCRESG